MKEKSFLSSVRGKVIAAFFLACLAIALAMVTTSASFETLLSKVDEISQPNPKLKTLNTLFKQITRLDQQQRADAIQNPDKPLKEYLKESKNLIVTLDSLTQMPWEDSVQVDRLMAMKRILTKRDYLLIEYLKLKSDFLSNKALSDQLDSLSEVLAHLQPQADSTVTTRETKVTTTTLLPEEKKRSFLGRIFGGKKQDAVEDRVAVKEEVSIRVDTLAVARQDSALLKIGSKMKTLDENQSLKTKEILERELKLINTNIALINQLLSILQEVESKEMKLVESKNSEAATLVTTSIERISIIIIVFFVLATLLVFLILIDISKSNYYRLQLIKAKEEAEQLSLVKQRFLANMSHEIRTPLQSIIGFSEQLKNGSDSEMLNAIQQSSEHLLQVVDEVLDYSRIESGQFTLTKESFRLDEIIREVTSVVRIQANQKKLAFLVESPQIVTPVMGDSFRLRQILYNLLSNAIKFTTEGSVRFVCTVTEETEQGISCQFEIADTGKGIPKEDQQRIFTQFEQGSGNIHRQYGGSGLGLSIVKKLLDLQQGTIGVKSEPGEGSTFTVRMNFEKDLTPATEEENYYKTITYTGPVWVIDDDPLILRLCSLILKNNNVPHRTFQHPEILLKEDLSGARVIFLDIRMPNINGVDLCKQLKLRGPHLTIIALTAHVLPQERESIMKSGFDRILTKPFKERELLETIGLSTEEQNEIDLGYLEKMTMGDAQLMNTILEEFEDETSRNLIELEKRLLDQDAGKAREIIHQLAGRIGQFGARPLSSQLKKIEWQLHEGKKTNEIPELRLVIEQVRNFQKELMDSMATTRSA